jgi:hypothetical protein
VLNPLITRSLICASSLSDKTSTEPSFDIVSIHAFMQIGICLHCLSANGLIAAALGVGR